MAPSSRNRSTRQTAQSQLSAFRITKSSKLNAQPETLSSQKTSAIEKAVIKQARPQQPQVAPSSTITTKSSRKRRRDSDTEDTDNGASTIRRTQKPIKKAKVLLTPPASSPEPEIVQTEQDLSEVLQELKDLHKAFTQALSVYIAHNKGGIRDAVDLAAVLPTMTRLWKRRVVKVEDVERVLAAWELKRGFTGGEIEHRDGPFKLEQNGIGLNKRITVEYVWASATGAFVESELQQKYEDALDNIFDTQRHDKDSFIWKQPTDSPRLRCEIGKVTRQRKEKVASIRDSILTKTKTPAYQPLQQNQDQDQQQQTQQPDLSTLSIHGPSTSPPRTSKPQQPQTSKSRTTNLFDRIRAKQHQNSTLLQPTAASLLRRRAIHRIPDLVDVLRLKQARKLLTTTTQSFHQNPNSSSNLDSQSGRLQMKVSFSFEALVQEIRDSLRSEVASEEIREGLLIMGREMVGEWCRVYEMGSVRCVTLQGEGIGAREVRSWCERAMNREGTARM